MPLATESCARLKKLKRMFTQGPSPGVVKDWPKAPMPLEVPTVLLVMVAALAERHRSAMSSKCFMLTACRWGAAEL